MIAGYEKGMEISMKQITSQKQFAKYQQEEFKNTGLLLGDIKTNRNTSRIFICFIRAFLIFLASFGTVGALVSAFQLDYYFFPVILTLLVLSLFIAFLYYNTITFYVGYIVVFILFILAIVVLYWPVNSGYQAFSNVVYEKYSDYFGLLSIRESSEFITDRMLTISITMVFIGFLLCLLLNITISGYMNLIETFLITFPLLQIALYINIKPTLPYLAMLLSVYITVGILGRSGHYRIPSIKDNQTLFYHIKKKEHIYHSYISDGPGMLTTGIYAILISSIFLFLTSGIFFRDFNSAKQSRLKTTTDEYVKTFVQTGIWGMFDRYASTGGLSHGQLGGVSSVRPDFQTDLEVTFVPYTPDTIYLKSYIGVNYTSNYFAPVSSSLEENNKFTQVYDGFADQLHDNGSYARMDIKNIDASDYFMPYDTYSLQDKETGSTLIYRNDTASLTSPDIANAFHTTSEIMTDISEDDYPEYTMYYIPYQNQITYQPDNTISAEYEAYVYENYLNVPDFLTPALNSFSEEAGLYEENAKFQETSVSTYESDDMKEQARRLNLAGKLDSYFMNNFEYTMAPGASPYSRDFVEYFLTTQKRGYCAHFASSAALLLRTFGIPTRYIEGYCIQPDNINNASAYSTSTSGWYQGANSLADTGVITASITDGQAHAWVEIYLDGYGWIPYEFTPPSSEEDTINLDFMSIFSGLFMTADANQNSNTTEADVNESQAPNYRISFNDSFGFLLKPFFILLSVLLAVYLILYFRKDAAQYIAWRKNLKLKNYAKAIQYEYKRFLYKFYRFLPQAESNLPPRQVADILYCHLSAANSLSRNNIDEFINLLERACFAPTTVTKEDYLKLHDCMKNYIQLLKKQRNR